MRKEIEELIAKADESLDAARLLFSKKYLGFSASRAYYAMFYIAEACLLTKGLAYSRHTGVIQGFNRHFVKTGLFDIRFYKSFYFAFEQRRIGDYDVGIKMTHDTAQKILDEAESFINSVKKYLKSIKE